MATAPAALNLSPLYPAPDPGESARGERAIGRAQVARLCV
jgi:hypothetical protein